MAQMFPRNLPDDVLSDPRRRAEKAFFTLCRDALPEQVVVVYGYRWVDPLDRKRAVEGEADFTIIDPERGILVLELKGGIICRDASTGKYFSREVRGQIEHEIKDPGKQAANSRRAIINKLEASRPWYEWRKRNNRDRGAFPACFGVVFPDCTADGKVIAGDITPANLIDCTHLNALADRVARIFSDLLGRNACLPLTREAMAAIQDVLAYDGTLRRPLAADLAEEDREMLSATKQQLNVLNVLRLHSRVLIQGGAGSGKTILAVEKARRAAVQGRRTLLLCYNELLGEFLKQSDAAKAGAHVMTFHSLCLALSELRPPNGSAADAHNRKRFFDEELPAAAYERLIEKEPERRYQTIVIDEAQDFLPTWYDIISQLAEPDAADQPPEYFLALDNDQLPPGRHQRLPEGLDAYPLDQNLRNTQCIFRATSGMRKAISMTCAGPLGDPPRRLTCSTVAQVLRAIETELSYYVTQGRIDPKDVIVLVGRSLPDSIVAAAIRDGRIQMPERTAAGSSIKVESVWRYKGLERNVVILAELDDMATNRPTLYVGATRAKLRLSIIGGEQVMQQFQRVGEKE
jgi:hypothetical protein